MPELTPADVEQYTDGRLDAEADETVRLLAAGLAAARTYCRWSVTPVLVDHEVTLDGPGSRRLVLPTLNLTELSAVVEDGDAIDVADLQWSADGLVIKSDGSCWTSKYRGIQVTMTHGFDSAPDWQSAVLSYIDRTSSGNLRAVGPFQYDTSSSSAFTESERMLLDTYRLEYPS